MDNQIIGLQSKNTIMGMFAGIESSLNKLLHSSDKFMGTKFLVPVQHEDDYSVITVNIVKNGQVSHEIEEGIRTHCNHLETEIENNKAYCTECDEFVEQDCL